MAVSADDLSYGNGEFVFMFKSGAKLRLGPSGFITDAVVPTTSTTCPAPPQAAVAEVVTAPPMPPPPTPFYDSAEAHLLSVCIAAVATTRVILRGLLALRQERTRAIESKHVNRMIEGR